MKRPCRSGSPSRRRGIFNLRWPVPGSRARRRLFQLRAARVPSSTSRPERTIRLLCARADLQRRVRPRSRRTTSSSRSSSCARRAMVRANRRPLFTYAFWRCRSRFRFARPPSPPLILPRARTESSSPHFFDPSHGGDPSCWAAPVWILRPPEVYNHQPAAFGIANPRSYPHVPARRSHVPLSRHADILFAFSGFGVCAPHSRSGCRRSP